MTPNERVLREALEGLMEAVRRDSDEGGKGISGYTGARMSDARAALASTAATPTSSDADIVEQCAKIVDAECERIMSKQIATNDPLSIEDSINLNIRMTAIMLPGIAASIRALAAPDSAHQEGETPESAL